MDGEVESLSALVLRLKDSARIGVDGTDGVRKTSISTELAQRLELPLISLDDYLVKNQGGFVEFLRYDELRSKFESVARFIVEGVCLLAVLERLGVSIDQLVYVKRYRHGLWADDRELDIAPEHLEEFLAQERQTIMMLSRLSGDPSTSDEGELSLAGEIVRYHAEYRPYKNADLVYRWNDG